MGKKILTFVLTVIMTLTMFPMQSFAADNVVKIETLTARLTKGAEKVGDDWVWKTGKQNSDGHRFVYRVTYAISGTREYEPGKVEIRIPKRVLLDREDEFADEYELSIPAFDDPEITDSDNTTKYVYREEGDEIVIYNRISVPGGDNGYFEVAYDTTKRTFYYADYGADSDESGPFKATMHIEQDAMSAEKETDEIFVYIDTHATIDRTQKSVAGKYNNWQSSWGDAPADADDYYYLVWQVRTWINPPTQPYNFRIVDTFDSSANGEVVGYRYQGESTFTENHWVPKQIHYSQLDRYDYVLTKYPKSEFMSLDYYELTNNVVATVDPFDEVDEDTTAYSNAYYRFEKPRYIKPRGHFDTEKRGLDYRDSYVDSSDDIRSFKLTDFQKEKIDRIDNLKYHTYTIGYQWPWTLQGDWQDPSNYGKKDVKTVIWDNEWYINKSNVGYEADYNEADKLTKDDFELTKIEFKDSCSSAVFDEETQGFKQVPSDANNTIDFYGEFNGEWVRVCTYNMKTGMYSNTAYAYLKSAHGKVIEFAPNCTGWKAEYSNNLFMMYLGVDPYVDLKDSAKVKAECADKDKVSLLNVMHSEMFDSSDKKITGFDEMGTDYIIGIDKHGHIEKYVHTYKNNKVKKNYTVHWRINAWEDFRDANAKQTYVTQESGVFYDLAPFGGEINIKSVKVVGVSEIEDFDVEVKKNYRDSGRDLLVVRVNEPTEEKYTVNYSTTHSWEIIKDTGNMFLNEVAYETGNEDIGDGLKDTGGHLESKEIMKNLDPSTNAEKFLYSEATHSADILTSANLGLLKKVKDSSDDDYSYKTVTKPNGEYSYKIRFATDDETRARDLILYDSLENYVVQEEGHDSHTSDWHGTLQSVDLAAVRKLGVAPKVYISTVSNINLSQQPDLTNASVWKEATDENINTAKAVAIDMRYKADGSEYILPKDTGVSVVLNMKAPENLNVDKDHIYAFNNIYLNNIAIDANDTEEHFYVHQDYTQIEYRVSAPVKITKVNANNHNEVIKDMTFNLSGKSDYGTDVDETKKSDGRGYVTFEDIEKGTYILKETKTNDDWLLNGQAYTVNIDYRGNVTIEGLEKDEGRFLFENKPRIHGDLNFRKKSLGQDEKTLRLIEQLKNADLYTGIRVDDVVVYPLDKKENQILVTTQAKNLPTYDDSMRNYENSIIRNYLNNDYYNSLPSAVHALISETTIKTAEPNEKFWNVTYNPRKIVETTDKVFLPSMADSVDYDYYKSFIDPDFEWDAEKLAATSFTFKATCRDRYTFNGTDNGNFYKDLILQIQENLGRKMYVGFKNATSTIGTSYVLMWLDISNTKPQLNIPNTTFKLEGTSDYGTEVTEYLTSNSVGRVTLENLEKGTYTLTETKANPDYIKNPDTWKVIVDENGQVTIKGAKTEPNGTQYLENEPYHNFSLRKTDKENGNWLEGAEFSLTGTSNYGTKVDMNETSNENGRVTFDMLESGSYVLKETKAPDKYQLNEKDWIVEIDKFGNTTITSGDKTLEVDDQGFIEFPNERGQEGKIKIIKKWKDGLTGEEAENRENPEITISTKQPEPNKGITVTKRWEGDSPSDRPDDIKVHLTKKVGEDYTEIMTSVSGKWTDNRDNTWSYDFRYAPADNEELYVWEESVDGYKINAKENEPVKVEDNKVEIKATFNQSIPYNVSIYDIEKDFDENGNIMGLTFGPGTRNDFSYAPRQHTPTGFTENNHPHRCVHNDDWDTIINWNNIDPYVYEQCIDEYCDKTVELTIPEQLWPTTDVTTSASQRNTSINRITFPIDKTHFVWNGVDDNTGGWGASHIRAFLNGKDVLTDVSVANNPEWTNFTPANVNNYNNNNSLIAAFPLNLRNAIGKRATKYYDKATQKSNLTESDLKTSYDKLWILHANEIFTPEKIANNSFNDTLIGSPYKHFKNIDNSNSTRNLLLETDARLWWLRGLSTSRDSTSAVNELGKLVFEHNNYESASVCPCFTLSRTPNNQNNTNSIPNLNLASPQMGVMNTPLNAPLRNGEDIASGTSEGGVDWRITSTGELIIGKEGEVQNLGNYHNGTGAWPWSSYKTQVISVRVEGEVLTNTCYGMFYQFSEMQKCDLTGLNTSGVESFGFMFNHCIKLKSINFGNNFDTSSANNLYSIFGDSTYNYNGAAPQAFRDIDISQFDTRNASNRTMYVGYNVSPRSIALGVNTRINIGSVYNPTYVRYATLDGRNVYNEEPILLKDYDGTKPGWYKRPSSLSVPNESELYDGYSTADDQSKWVKVSDDTWEYTFDVFDDEAMYYAWEEWIDAYDSDTYRKNYQIINDPDNPDKNIKTVTVTNTKEDIPPEDEEKMPGKLKLSKTVVDGDNKKDFQFNITLNMEGTKVLNGVIFKEGKGTVFLKHGETFELDLPHGTTYEVEEVPNKDYNVSSEGESGTIEGNKTSEAKFTNTKKTEEELPTGGFTLKKQVKGDLGDIYENFTFNVSFAGLAENTQYTFGEPFTSDANGDAEVEVKLKSGEEVSVDGLPVGSKYKITEKASRYEASYEIKDANGGMNIVQPKGANDELWMSLSTARERVDEGEDITVKFTNLRELETTTGVGSTIWKLLLGVLIVLVLMLIKKKRQAKNLFEF